MPVSADQRVPQRVRNELRFRHIQVASKTNIAGKFWRIRFSGSDLAGFTSPGFDDHIKVFFLPLKEPHWLCHKSPMRGLSGRKGASAGA